MMNIEDIFSKMKMYIETGEIDSAFKLMSTLDDAKFTNSEYTNAKAILLREIGQILAAEKILLEGLVAYPECSDIYYNLGYIYYEKELFVESAICFATYCRLEDSLSEQINESVKDIELMMKEFSKLYVVFESFRKASNQDYVFIGEKSFADDTLFMMLNQILNRFNNRIYYFLEPVEVLVEAFPELDEVLDIIIENMETSHGTYFIRPIVLQTTTDTFDTTPYILKRIKEGFSPSGHCNVVCLSEFLDKIVERDTVDGLGNQFEIIFAPADHNVKGIVSFSFYGDYNQTLNRLYHIDTSSGWDGHSLTISIVIPTRNSANILEHTLRTCLQDQGKDFEIVISDNSWVGNDDTLLLVQQLNDPRIKYYRPERELTLKENFEYAYCLAQGEFIFSIGSDDAVLHRGLEILREILKRYPDQDVLIWDRLMYMWPGVGQGQDDLLSIPSNQYRPEKVEVKYIESDLFLQAILDLQVSMYYLPMFYINSGFRRRYIGKMIEKSGKFLDGGTQDIYTGLINYALNDQLLHIMHPITVAGMSVQSTGVLANKMLESSTVEDEYIKKNRQIANQRMYATKVLPLKGYSDKWLLFSEYSKICQKNINQKFKLNRLNWKKAYSSCAELLSETDPSFNERIHEFEESAAALGDKAFLKWFKETYSRNPNFKGVTYLNIVEKKYLWGIQNDGSLILDASLFNISNVYEVCNLVYKLYRI